MQTTEIERRTGQEKKKVPKNVASESCCDKFGENIIAKK